MKKEKEKQPKKTNALIEKIKNSDITIYEQIIIGVALLLVGIWVLKHLFALLIIGVVGFAGWKYFKPKLGNSNRVESDTLEITQRKQPNQSKNTREDVFTNSANGNIINVDDVTDDELKNENEFF